MGMSINKAQSNLRNIQRYYIKADNETIDFAIDILRKYQKITEIVQSKTTRVSYNIGFRQIKKVVEDGKS